MSNKLNTREAATFLCLSPGTLEVWRSQGRGPMYAKLGRRVVYDRIDLEKFVASRKTFTSDAMPS